MISIKTSENEPLVAADITHRNRRSKPSYPISLQSKKDVFPSSARRKTYVLMTKRVNDQGCWTENQHEDKGEDEQYQLLKIASFCQ